MACTFSTAQLPKVLRTCVCSIPGFAPNDSAPAAVVSFLFDPVEPQSLEKYNASRLCYLFAHLHLLSSGSFRSLIFFLLTFSSSSRLCCFICPYCRKLDLFRIILSQPIIPSHQPMFVPSNHGRAAGEPVSPSNTESSAPMPGMAW